MKEEEVFYLEIGSDKVNGLVVVCVEYLVSSPRSGEQDVRVRVCLVLPQFLPLALMKLGRQSLFSCFSGKEVSFARLFYFLYERGHTAQERMPCSSSFFNV